MGCRRKDDVSETAVHVRRTCACTCTCNRDDGNGASADEPSAFVAVDVTDSGAVGRRLLLTSARPLFSPDLVVGSRKINVVLF